MNPEPLAVLAEQAADVGGLVGEEITRIRVLGDAAARELRLEAVDGPASVGVDEAAEEGLRPAVDDCALSPVEHDRAVVLSARPVLGEDEWPVLVCGLDHHSTVRPPGPDVHVDFLPQAQRDRHDAIVDHVGVEAIEHDSELVAPARRAHATVAEIETEQQAVCPAVERNEALHAGIFRARSDSRLRRPTPWGSELMAMRAVSKTVNPGSNPGSPA